MHPTWTLKSAVMAAGLAAGLSAGAGTISFEPPWGPNGGGEFRVTASTDFGSFRTFCLEYDEHMSIPNTYDYVINSKAMGGGPGYSPNGDPLSIGTAWLYSQFQTGTLSFEGNTYDTVGDQGALQMAFWWLEEESSAPGYANGSNNLWVRAVKAALGLNDAGVRANSNGAYGVVALNLDPLGASTTRKQDVLARTVPDAGWTLGMAGGGLALLGFLRRRLA